MAYMIYLTVNFQSMFCFEYLFYEFGTTKCQQDYIRFKYTSKKLRHELVGFLYSLTGENVNMLEKGDKTTIWIKKLQ